MPFRLRKSIGDFGRPCNEMAQLTESECPQPNAENRWLKVIQRLRCRWVNVSLIVVFRLHDMF